MKKFSETVDANKRDEFDDLYRKVSKKGKKVGDELENVAKRVKDFDTRLQDSTYQGINDIDMAYVRKEVLRLDSSIKVSRGIHRETLKQLESTKDTVSRRPDG